MYVIFNRQLHGYEVVLALFCKVVLYCFNTERVSVFAVFALTRVLKGKVGSKPRQRRNEDVSSSIWKIIFEQDGIENAC